MVRRFQVDSNSLSSIRLIKGIAGWDDTAPIYSSTSAMQNVSGNWQFKRHLLEMRMGVYKLKSFLILSVQVQELGEGFVRQVSGGSTLLIFGNEYGRIKDQ